MIQSGCIPQICEFLDTHDLRVTGVSLEGLKKFLAIGAQSEDLNVQALVESSGGLEKIELLENHPNEVLAQIAFEIRKTYFTETDMDWRD